MTSITMKSRIMYKSQDLKFNIRKIGAGIFFIFYQTRESVIFEGNGLCAFSTNVETPT